MLDNISKLELRSIDAVQCRILSLTSLGASTLATNATPIIGYIKPQFQILTLTLSCT